MWNWDFIFKYYTSTIFGNVSKYNSDFPQSFRKVSKYNSDFPQSFGKISGYNSDFPQSFGKVSGFNSDFPQFFGISFWFNSNFPYSFDNVLDFVLNICNLLAAFPEIFFYWFSMFLEFYFVKLYMLFLILLSHHTWL